MKNLLGSCVLCGGFGIGMWGDAWAGARLLLYIHVINKELFNQSIVIVIGRGYS